MPKQALPTGKSEIVLDQNALVPLYRQLYERLRSAILAGRLETGARLPSTRVLASELGVSRNTTALAYELLLLEGYIESRVGDGTRVAYLQPEDQVHQNTEDQVDVANLQVPVLSQRAQLLLDTPYPGELDVNQVRVGTGLFSVGQPDMAYFPNEIWARLVAKHARRSLHSFSFYQDVQGYAPLREAIAAHIGITRGVHCLPEQVVLTSGAQGALDLVARVLLNPGDLAWVENPGYWGAQGSLLAVGARLVSVPVDREGIDVEAGRQLCPDARLAVVTPSHQFPTGVTMSLSRRLALLEWAREAQAWIIEDDYDSEFRFSGRPLEALQGLDNARRVIYIGTFSKVLFPSLRLGYLVVPPALLQAFLAVRRFIDMYPPMLEQLALTDFIVEGYFARHLRKMRLVYLERRNILINVLKQEVGDLLEIVVPEAGMHLVVWFPIGVNAQTITERAAARGLYIQSISGLGKQMSRHDGLLLGFASASPQALRAGVKTLAEVIRAL